MKYFALIILGILILGLVSGCSDKNDNPEENVQKTETGTQNTDLPSENVDSQTPENTADSVTNELVDPEDELDIGDVI
ncbi:hypothetical protein K9L67_01100 [Candidatus Woesearchaeota archaeon]|nr:hypothetical protein [Candidatus Woesearchaeota archaeon]MCF7900801.1 hypothetical protein [Candidatus Woesearchaeota archaeon]MCF8013103.1 hypothetical protein [Candidatus Woesearchaeota archaeon]